MRALDFSTLAFDREGLIPVIAQDAQTGQVLMMAFANLETLRESMQIGKLVFFSRSRNQRWLKGETSGNFLEIVEILADCDSDTLLAKVRPLGPACHNGTTTCFEERPDVQS